MIVAALALLTLCGTAVADGACAADARELSLPFDSGAQWQMCARVDAQAGLVLTDIRYRAPGDAARSVLSSLSIGSAMLHVHGESLPQRIMPNDARTPRSTPCDGQTEPLAEAAALCLTRHDTGLLVRYGDIRGVRGNEWRVTLDEGIDALQWRTRIAFGETGRLTPALSAFDVSPQQSDQRRFGVQQPDGQRLAERSMLSTWRLAFDLDGGEPDRVEEFDFTLQQGSGSRRVMRVTPLDLETLRTVAHETFRGWRVRTERGAGYYLDSQSASTGWSGGGGNWTRFALAVTADDDRSADSSPLDLDRIVNAESLIDRHPVLWPSGSAVLSPRNEDGARASARVAFDLLPFDWTERSPFAPQDAP